MVRHQAASRTLRSGEGSLRPLASPTALYFGRRFLLSLASARLPDQRRGYGGLWRTGWWKLHRTLGTSVWTTEQGEGDVTPVFSTHQPGRTSHLRESPRADRPVKSRSGPKSHGADIRCAVQIFRAVPGPALWSGARLRGRDLQHPRKGKERGRLDSSRAFGLDGPPEKPAIQVFCAASLRAQLLIDWLLIRKGTILSTS